MFECIIKFIGDIFMQKIPSFLKNAPHFVVWAFLFVAIVGLSMLTSFFPIWVNIPVNVIIPILILVFLKPVFFERLKLTTLVILRAAIVPAVFLFVYAGVGAEWFIYVVLLFLAINILEATFTDLKHKCYYNFVSGLVLAATILTLIPGVRWISLMQGNDLAYAFTYEVGNQMVIGTVCWWIAYTIWNWIFVTDEFSSSIAYLHIGILGAPIAAMLIMMIPGVNPGNLMIPASLWLVFRANSLTVGGIFQITCKQFIEEKLHVPTFDRFVKWTKTRNVQIVLMIANLILMAVPAYFSISALIK